MHILVSFGTGTSLSIDTQHMNAGEEMFLVSTLLNRTTVAERDYISDSPEYKVSEDKLVVSLTTDPLYRTEPSPDSSIVKANDSLATEESSIFDEVSI